MQELKKYECGSVAEATDLIKNLERDVARLDAIIDSKKSDLEKKINA